MDGDRVSGDVVSTTGARAPIVLAEGAVLARKYRLVRTAGFGGMAQLWVAQNEATGAEVCIKVLVPAATEGAGAPGDDEAVERFRREAHAAARLSHRAIVRIFDLLELDAEGESVPRGGKIAALAIVMELLHGETLSDFIMKRGRLALEEAIDLALPFLSALAHAHRAGVVHRDVKPDNIFLATDPDGHVTPKVLDFGVSKLHAPDVKPLTFDGVMLGTPSFMSPEQARGAKSVDARSDVFSAAIVFYMMLAGKNPFDGERFHSVINAIIEREPPRIDGVPDGIWEVVEKALAKDPDARYADATELGIALRKAAGRTSPTDSGVHSTEQLRAALAAQPPVSSPSIASESRAVPLGGDSIVTVPPASGESDEAAPRDAADRAAISRRRAVRVVLGVVGAALAILLVAFVKSSLPSGEPATKGASSRGGAPPSIAPPSIAPPSASVPAPPEEAPAPSVRPAEPAPVTVAADAGAPKRAPPTPLPPPRPKNKEPSIVRDPGF
ncbi:MAG: serine/threonine protein kinase [Labilithrix sp.]|nr:serine/threonine protein kinase [Labilithrix sp.]